MVEKLLLTTEIGIVPRQEAGRGKTKKTQCSLSEVKFYPKRKRSNVTT